MVSACIGPYSFALMADERSPSQQPPAASSQSDPEPKGGEDPTFSHDEHRAGARAWYGESPHLVAGALASAKRKNLTQDEVKGLVRDFKKHKDTTDRGDE